MVQDRTETTGYLRAAVPLCLDNNFTCRAAGTLSDIRLKRAIALLGKRADGIALYRYRYWWSDTDHVGVMAQEAGANPARRGVARRRRFPARRLRHARDAADDVCGVEHRADAARCIDRSVRARASRAADGQPRIAFGRRLQFRTQ